MRGVPRKCETQFNFKELPMKAALTRIAAAALLAGGSVASHADTVAFLGYANGSASINYSITSTPSATSGSAGAGGILTSLNAILFRYA